LEEPIPEAPEFRLPGVGDRIPRDELLGEWIDEVTILDHPIIEMGSRRETGRANVADHLLLPDTAPVADPRRDCGQVVVHGTEAPSMLDEDRFAVATVPPRGEDNPVGDSPGGRAVGGGIIDG
jgi:hypothetical protein